VSTDSHTRTGVFHLESRLNSSDLVIHLRSA
jgi:hypothetical protein